MRSLNHSAAVFVCLLAALPIAAQEATPILYDPVTGVLLTPAPAAQFDPRTGLPLAPRPAPAFDPLTGLPVEVEPETPAPTPTRFDPATGESLDEALPVELSPAARPPNVPSAVDRNIGLRITLEKVIASAEAEALQDHNFMLHRIVGITGCLFTWIGLPITTLYAEYSGSSQFDRKTAMLTASGSYYHNLPPELQIAYKKTYQNKEKSLRRQSVYSTQAVCLLPFILLMFLSI